MSGGADPGGIPREWVEARRRHKLSDRHVQQARELGLNPRKLGKIDNHGQEPWKLPLPEFIEQLYMKRFGRRPPRSRPGAAPPARRAGPVPPPPLP
ncbi:MAG: hypothetical protein ACRDRK_25950 [Pseudonocardia sp.]